MPKGWRIELEGADGTTQVVTVAIADQSKAIRAALAKRPGSHSVIAYPLSDESYRKLSLSSGQVLGSKPING